MTVRKFVPRLMLVLAAAGFIGIAGNAATTSSADARPGWGHGRGYDRSWRGDRWRHRRYERRRRWAHRRWRHRYDRPRYYHPRPFRPVRRLLWGLHNLFHPHHHW